MLTVESFAQYLPAVLRKAATEAGTDEKTFIERFVNIFEDEFAVIESKVDKIPKMFHPWKAEEEFLPYIASWLALELPEGWGEATKRALLDNITDIYNKRGTLEGLRIILKIYLGAAVKEIREDENNPHVFIVTVFFPQFATGELARSTRAIRQVINIEKPAHTDFSWNILTPTMQICTYDENKKEITGHSQIGVNTILGTSPNIDT